jgi:hypothetical protein
MARLMLLAQRPPNTSCSDAEEWLRRQIATLSRAEGLESVALTRLASPSARWSRVWTWLIELDFAAREDACRAASDPAYTDLLGELRLLGMRPSLTMTDGAVELDLDSSG